ncbi:lamin tail domain-containing protein [Candidatus Kaiserbacteria bacterium]|nr:lamin tail domain-containing protein [Candidatus Kaiserbacteria bacterium]
MRKRMLCTLLVFFTGIFPALASAQVIISEIMYDAPGTEGSGEHDWIEVFNAGGASIDLSTYRFVEANTNHTLKLDRGLATLPSGGYAVIANSTGVFIADYPTFSGTLFDSSFNLSSSGESIGIRTGDLADSDPAFTYVPSDFATNNGGSLHRVAVSGTAFTANTPSPGSGSLVAQVAQESDTNTQTATTSNATSTATTTQTTLASVSSYVPPPLPKLYADAGHDRTVIVGADTLFDGRAYNRQQEIESNVRFSWNFGDGSTAEGPHVRHHFEYPGRYAVILNIAQDIDAAADQVIVTAESAHLGFIVHADNSIAVENLSGHDLDLSGWVIRSFGREFMLPEKSIILAEEALRIGYIRLGFTVSAHAELAYPNGIVALKAGERSETSSVSADNQTSVHDEPQKSETSRTTSPAARTPHIEVQKTEADEIRPGHEATTSALTASAGAVRATGRMGNYMWWLLAAVIAMVAGGATIAARRIKQSEWDITEE